MSSFDTQSTYQGEDVWDTTQVYWARFNGEINWCAPNGATDSMEYKPWPYPEHSEFSEPDWEEHFQRVTNGVGWHYQFYIEQEEIVPEGILFRHDPQVNVGLVWGLFDPSKEIKRPNSEKKEPTKWKTEPITGRFSVSDGPDGLKYDGDLAISVSINGGGAFTVKPGHVFGKPGDRIEILGSAGTGRKDKHVSGRSQELPTLFSSEEIDALPDH